MQKMIGLVAVVSAVMGIAACSAETDGSAPDAFEDGLDAKNVISQGGYTGTAQAPVSAGASSYPNRMKVKASAVFTGPAGTTYKMGVCALQMTGVPCTGTDGDDPTYGYLGPCAQALGNPANNGYRYCTAPGGSGQKYCALRPGSQQAYCAGSPALGGALVAPGTYTTLAVSAPLYSSWVSEACFFGCKGSDPSVSSAAVTDCNPSPTRYNSCINSGFTWYWETCQCQP